MAPLENGALHPGFRGSCGATCAASFASGTAVALTGDAGRRFHLHRLERRLLRYRHAAFTWTDPTVTAGTTQLKTVHILELRTALNHIYQALGRTVPTYTDPALVAGETVVKAAHIQELRTAVNALP